MQRICVAVTTVLLILLSSSPLLARSLKEKLEGTLFGGPSAFFFDDGTGRPLLSADPDPRSFGKPLLAIGSLGSALTNTMQKEILSESAVIPLPSGSAGFAFRLDPGMGMMIPQPLGLGTIFNDRAYTLGRGVFAVGVSYIRQDFDEYNGQDISRLRVRRGLFARPPDLGALIDSGDVAATLDLDITTNSVAIWASYGLTDWLDVSFLLPITVIDLRARSVIRQVNPQLSQDLPAFRSNQQCTFDNAFQTPTPCRIADFTLIRQGTPFSIAGTDERPFQPTALVDETRSGVGDLLLRSKARFFEGSLGTSGGLIELTLPSGEKDDFLGDGAFKARFLLLHSLSFFNDRLHFHLNGGGRVTTQSSSKNTLEYGTSADVKVTERLSVVAELIGSYRVDSGGLADNFIDAAFGFKANLVGGLILSASFRIPATDDGLRSDLIYFAGLEYDF